MNEDVSSKTGNKNENLNNNIITNTNEKLDNLNQKDNKENTENTNKLKEIYKFYVCFSDKKHLRSLVKIIYSFINFIY